MRESGNPARSNLPSADVHASHLDRKCKYLNVRNTRHEGNEEEGHHVGDVAAVTYCCVKSADASVRIKCSKLIDPRAAA